MNLIEALKSGRRFKRPDWGQYTEHDLANPDDIIPLTPADIVADDWEVEEIIVPITDAYFEVAWQRAESKQPAGKWLAHPFKDTLKKELGL
jgi:hypothetical protein